MFLKYVFMAIIALSFGLIVSGGVLTVFVSVGLIPRFAGKTHSGNCILLYETMVCAGTITGCIVSVFNPYLEIGKYVLTHVSILQNVWIYLANSVLIIFGFFAGMFIGCFAIAIAEMMDTIPIFFRRSGFRHGLGIAMLMIALGKIAGSFFYFIKQMYFYGGT